jgi:hypothetical protein
MTIHSLIYSLNKYFICKAQELEEKPDLRVGVRMPNEETDTPGTVWTQCVPYIIQKEAFPPYYLLH